MEYETTKKDPTLLELLGADKPEKENIGLIREYQAWIHRRALDYLVVGLATDIDDDPQNKTLRFDSYVDTIESDLAHYRDEAKKWDITHLENTLPALWQTQFDYDQGKEVRRFDLPSEEVCKQSMIGESSQRQPERELVCHVAKEGIDVYFDQALDMAKDILEEKMKEIRYELPVAPYEAVEEGIKTQDVLKEELEVITSRLNIIEQISNERKAEVIEETLDAGESEPEDDLDVYERQPSHVFAKVGGKILRLADAR